MATLLCWVYCSKHKDIFSVSIIFQHSDLGTGISYPYWHLFFPYCQYQCCWCPGDARSRTQFLKWSRSWSAQVRSCDPDRLIAFHKRQSQSVNQIEKIRNQAVYCQLKHDINQSLGNLEIKLLDRSLMKNIRLMTSIHYVTMVGVAASFMYNV